MCWNSILFTQHGAEGKELWTETPKANIDKNDVNNNHENRRTHQIQVFIPVAELYFLIHSHFQANGFYLLKVICCDANFLIFSRTRFNEDIFNIGRFS